MAKQDAESDYETASEYESAFLTVEQGDHNLLVVNCILHCLYFFTFAFLIRMMMLLLIVWTRRLDSETQNLPVFCGVGWSLEKIEKHTPKENFEKDSYSPTPEVSQE